MLSFNLGILFYSVNDLGMWTAINESWKKKINVAKSDSYMEFILSKFCIGSISPATVIWVNIIAFIVHSLYLLGESQFFFLRSNPLRQSPKSLYHWPEDLHSTPCPWLGHTVSLPGAFPLKRWSTHPCKLRLLDFYFLALCGAKGALYKAEHAAEQRPGKIEGK